MKNIEGKNEEQSHNQLELVKTDGIEKESLNKLQILNMVGQDAEKKYNEIKKMISEFNYSNLFIYIQMGRYITSLFLEE